MRMLLAAVLVCSLVAPSRPARAERAHPIRAAVAVARTRVERLEARWHDPIERKKLFVKGGFNGMTMLASVVAQRGLQHLGVDPLAASFAAGLVITTGGHYAQQGLAKISRGYLDAPAFKSSRRLVFDGVVGGGLGIVGQVGVDRVAALFPSVGSGSGAALVGLERTVLRRAVIRSLKAIAWARGRATAAAIGARSDQGLDRARLLHQKLRRPLRGDARAAL